MGRSRRGRVLQSRLHNFDSNTQYYGHASNCVDRPWRVRVLRCIRQHHQYDYISESGIDLLRPRSRYSNRKRPQFCFCKRPQNIFKREDVLPWMQPEPHGVRVEAFEMYMTLVAYVILFKVDSMNWLYKVGKEYNVLIMPAVIIMPCFCSEKKV